MTMIAPLQCKSESEKSKLKAILTRMIVVDGLSGDWVNPTLRECMGTQPDRQPKACSTRTKPTLQQLRSQGKRRKVTPYYQ